MNARSWVAEGLEGLAAVWRGWYRQARRRCPHCGLPRPQHKFSCPKVK